MPSSRLTVAGVTGTNGKTTCAWLLASAAERLARRGAYLGTLGAGFPPQVAGGALTTPDVIIAAPAAARARGRRARAHVAMEVSSHALDQRRVDGVRLRVAAFSNLTRDHLDYHGTMERYAEAKARLFRLPGLEHAVINVGDPVGARFAAALRAGRRADRGRRRRRSARGRALRARRRVIRAADRGLELEIRGHFGARRLRSPLIGAFNAENLAVTLGVLLARGIRRGRRRSRRSPSAAAPPGRMEGYRLPSGALAVVDYAHTPDALAKALAAVRAHARGRVLVVFGCGGERDPGKRPLMGEAAERLADRVIVTDDNPRGEDADRIVAMILEGMRQPGRGARRARPRARDRRGASPRRGPATPCWSPARVTRTTRSSAASGAPSATASACANAREVRDEGPARGRRGGRRRAPRRAPMRRSPASPPTRARSSRACCSWRCAASASTATHSSRPRPRAAPRAPWSRSPPTCRCRRWSSATRRRRSPRLPPPGAHAAAPLVLGVGGSNGKTTTKELLAAILAGAGPTLATRGNLNNHIGVPLTLLRLEPAHRHAVIEMGANHPGEIAALAALAKPAIALVTNAGDEHLEGFGDLAGVARAEGEMFARARRRRHGRHQRRRPVRGAVAGDGAARRAHPALRHRGARGRARRGHRGPHRVAARSSPRSRSRSAARRRGSGCRSRAATTCRTRSAPRPPRTPPASRCRRSSRASSACAPSPADCS